MRRTFTALLLLGLSVFLTAGAPPIAGRVITHGFPLRSPSSLPACTAADSCVLDCYATSSSWECRKADGTSVAVTQGVGTTFVQTPWGWAAQIDADAETPSVAAATMEATLPGGSSAFYDGSYSVLIVSQPGLFGGTINGLIGHYNAVPGGVSAYNDSTQSWFRHHGSVGTGSAQVANAYARWAAVIGSVASSGTPTARAAGAENTGAAGTGTPNAVTTPFYFGRLDPVSGAGTNLGGYLARVRIYSKALSATERATLERQAFGAVGSDGRELTTVRASTAWMEHADGSVVAYGSNLPRVRSDYGLLVEGTRTNLLTYSADFSQAAWLKAGLTGPMTPVVTVDQATAPDGTLTADKIDFGATTAEGDYSVVHQPPGGAAATYAGSVYLRTVTGSGTLYIGVRRSATNTDFKSTACSVTTTWSRCYVEGAVASTTAESFFMGPWSFDAAQPNAQPALSVYVWGAQLEAGFGATSVMPTGAAAVQRANENITASVVGFPNYDATMCATLHWDRDVRDRSASYLGNMLFDTLGAGSTQPGVQFWAWYEGGVGAFVDTATRTYTPVFPYDARLCVRRTYNKKFAVVGGSSAASTGATYLQAGHTTLRLGSYSGTALPLNGYLRDFTVSP